MAIINEKQEKVIAELCESIGQLQTTVLTRRACQIFEYLHQIVDSDLTPQDDAQIVRRMTAAMREADRTFERTGGSTKHHIEGCLLPILAKHGLKLVAIDKQESGNG